MDTSKTPTPNLSDLPVRVDRDTGAKLLTKYFFTISPRTLERWPLSWRRLNGKAHVDTVELFGVAEAMLADAPVTKGGQRSDHQQAA